MPRESGSQAVSAAWEPAKLAVQEVGAWIKNADAKATILAGALGVSVTFAATSLRTALSFWNALPGDVLRTVVLLGAVTALVSVLVTAYNLWCTVVPRTGSNRPNPFSWPDLASDAAVTTPPPVGELAVTEAWNQAKTLSKIAEQKYRHLKRAMIFFAVYVLSVGVCALLLLAA